jgi:hypothetical protein
MSSDEADSAADTFDLPASGPEALEIEAYKSAGMVGSADTIVQDEQVQEGFRRVERADGTIERHYDDSVWIIALDGTTTTWRPDLTATVFHADGARTEIDQAGASHAVRSDGSAVDEPVKTDTDPDGTIRRQLPSGAVVVAHLDGSNTLVLPDGTRSTTRIDGTVERTSENGSWKTGVDGTTAITRTDGSASTIHPDGSRTDVTSDGEIREIDSGERRALSDEVVVEEAPERSTWVRLILPTGILILVVGGALLLLSGGDGDPEVEYIVPEAVEALQAAPEEFDQVAWCADVAAAFDAQNTLDRALSTGSPEEVEAASEARTDSIDAVAVGAPPQLVDGWQVALVGVTADAAALSDAGHEFDRYLRAQPDDVTVPAQALDLFLTEQFDACVAASIEA